MPNNNTICQESNCSPNNFSEIFNLINIIYKKYGRLHREVMSEEKLTPAQYSILELLWESDGKQFKELSTACCCSQSTITGIVD
ncbi:MAG: MarR family winged helix-turn-helix transcriptional regulator, partial [Candidatus Thorarchaeota archaeon]